MTIKINLEELFGSIVGDYAYYLASYEITCKDPDKTSENKYSNYRNFEAAEKALLCVCSVLGFDMQKAITIYRLTQKWEKARNWEKCFPLNAHYDAIIQYLKKE